MSGDAPDSRDQRRAMARAQAALIADASRPVRRLTAPPGVRLHRAERKRLHARRGVAPVQPAPSSRGRSRGPWLRRGVAAALLVAQMAVLVLALTLPAFQVHRVAVSGTRLLAPGAVVAAAGVPEQSIFTVDGRSIVARVLALPWVRSAVVSTELPATVRITLVERDPVLRVRRGSTDTLVAADGATLPASAAGPSTWTATPALIDDRTGSASPLRPELVQMLGAIAETFPSSLGCAVAAYVWGADGVVSIWAASGWRAVLGHLDTAAALAALPDQIATLAAPRGRLDYANPTFGYLDVESASAPASGGRPGLPSEVSAALLPDGAGVPAAGLDSSGLLPR